MRTGAAVSLALIKDRNPKPLDGLTFLAAEPEIGEPAFGSHPAHLAQPARKIFRDASASVAFNTERVEAGEVAQAQD